MKLESVHGDNSVVINMGAIEIERGKTYVIESLHTISHKAKERYLNYLHELTGAFFVILDGGLKIARSEFEEDEY